jgi:acrylyl-CoA reductase (NADPH)
VSFKALIIEEGGASLSEVDESDLPDGSAAVDVAYSSLNYKDALGITGRAPIARSFPMIAGIDLAGVVTGTGEEVVATGQGLGETHWGGLAQKARLDGDWLVPLPGPFTLKQAMAIGTAGFTAMLCVLALEDHGVEGDVLVTGANGGVGSIAVAVLAKLGHQVIAATGRSEHADDLRRLGAAEVIDRAELSEPGKPLAKQRWSGAVDTVGGQVLANVCAATRYGGAVAACGNAGGMDVPASVAPFILRAVTLVGVDSVQTPRERRVEAWRRLGEDLDPALLDSLTHEIALGEVPDAARELLDGRVRGRTVVDVNRLDARPRRPGTPGDGERAVAEFAAAALAQVGAPVLVELGEVRAGRPDPERERLPPVVEGLVLDADLERGFFEVAEAGLLEDARERGELRLVADARIALAGGAPEGRQRRPLAGVVPDARGNAAAGARDARHLAQSGHGIGHEVHDELREHHVERGVAEGQGLRRRDVHVDARMALVRRGGERVRRVHRGDGGHAQALDQHGGQRTGPAADVQRLMPGAHAREVRQLRREPRRVAPHEAVVRVGGDVERHAATIRPPGSE